MSERYTRLFRMTENLYTEGAPVVIAAGALLKDTQNGRVLAQLKLQSISDKRIKAATVKLNPYDSAGRPLDDVMTYQYLDLNVSRDEFFGQKNPLPFKSDIVRSFDAAIVEVVFADNGIWQSEANAKWEPLAKPISLEKHFSDVELAEQYRLTFGEGCCCFPTKDRDLWRCACGEVNCGTEAKCHSCGAAYAWFTDFDLGKLAEERDARVEAERIAAEEAAAKAEMQARNEAAKRLKKKIIIRNSIIIGVIAMLIVISPFAIINYKESQEIYKERQEQLYNEAVISLEANRFDTAIQLLTELEEYRDSEALLIEAKYRRARYYYDKQMYQTTIDILTELGDYKDSQELLADANARLK